MKPTISSVLALTLALCLAGCGGGRGVADTPEGTVQAFLEAVQAGDAEAVAALFDYEAYARQENEDWDDIPKGQRDLIVKKLIEERAQALEPGLSQFQQTLAEAEVGEVEATDDQAFVSLKNVPGFTLPLVRREGKWYISGL